MRFLGEALVRVREYQLAQTSFSRALFHSSELSARERVWLRCTGELGAGACLCVSTRTQEYP